MAHADFIEHIGRAIEVAGVALIVAGLMRALWRSWRRVAGTRATQARHDMGQAILLGLEVLVAADIVRTVAFTPKLARGPPPVGPPLFIAHCSYLI
jgi:uncharacterized membrane protein